MKDTIEENNRLRNEQLGNRRVDELTKREHFAAMALGGLLANIDYNIGSSISSSVVEESVRLADLLVEKLNENKSSQS